MIRHLLGYAVWKDIIETNPAHDISVVAAQPRKRVLTDHEVHAVWMACERPISILKLILSPQMGVALRFALVMLQRGGEVVGMLVLREITKPSIFSTPGPTAEQPWRGRQGEHLRDNG